jgi:hypothetical protein
VQEHGATNKQWALFLQPYKIMLSDGTMLLKSEALTTTAEKKLKRNYWNAMAPKLMPQINAKEIQN